MSTARTHSAGNAKAMDRPRRGECPYGCVSSCYQAERIEGIDKHCPYGYTWAPPKATETVPAQ